MPRHDRDLFKIRISARQGMLVHALLTETGKDIYYGYYRLHLV